MTTSVVPAAVLGMEGPASVGVIRCLAETQVPLIGVDFTASRNYSFKSRFLKRTIILRDEGKETVLRLAGLRISGSVLLPVNGHFLAMTARMKSQLSEHFRLFTPNWAVISKCLDKWKLYQNAKSLGIPTPRTFCPSNQMELGRLLKTKVSRGSWVLKPRSGLPEHRSKKVFGNEKAILASGTKQIKEICTAVYREKKNYPLIQEFVTGHLAKKFVVNVFLDANGKVLRAMSEKKLRSFPLQFGAGSLFETCYEPKLIETAIKFYQGVGFYGQGNVEFIFDEKDKEYKLNEVNPRFNLGVITHKACGFDSPTLFYKYALGKTESPCFEYPLGVRSLYAGDMISIWRNRSQVGLRQPLADVFLNLHRIRNFECLSLSDPIPLFDFLGSRTLSALHLDRKPHLT